MMNYIDESFHLENENLVSTLDEAPLWSVPFGLDLLETIQYRTHCKVLDIGSGLGFPIIEIAQRLGSTCELYGIDPWEKAIERALYKIEVYKLSNIKIFRGVAEELPFENNSFELLVSNNGINNVSDIQQSLLECYRVSKPDAQFILTMNLPETMIEFYDVFEGVLIAKNRMKEIDLMKNHIQTKRKSLSEMKSLLRNAGFSINKVVRNKFNWKFTNGTAMLNHHMIKLAFLDSWKQIIPNNIIKEVFHEIEFELNRRSKKQDFLNLSIPFVTIDCKK